MSLEFAIATPAAPPHKPREYGGFMARLSAAQKDTLFQWLTQDGITYKAASLRLFQQWKMRANPRQLCRFWQSYCIPRQAREQAASTGKVLFEIVIQVRERKAGP